jgi:hypothetical protein
MTQIYKLIATAQPPSKYSAKLRSALTTKSKENLLCGAGKLLHGNQRDRVLASSCHRHRLILKVVKIVLETETGMKDDKREDSDSDHAGSRY